MFGRLSVSMVDLLWKSRNDNGTWMWILMMVVMMIVMIMMRVTVMMVAVMMVMMVVVMMMMPCWLKRPNDNGTWTLITIRSKNGWLGSLEDRATITIRVGVDVSHVTE